MKIHTSPKSISGRAMYVILKSKILTTVEESRSEYFRIFGRGQFSMLDIKPKTVEEIVDKFACKDIEHFSEEQ